MSIEIRLRGRPPRPSDVWDQAHALGQAILDADPTIRGCRLSVNDNRRAVFGWRFEAHVAEVRIDWSLVAHHRDVLDTMNAVDGAWDRLRPKLAPPTLPPVRGQGDIHDLGAVQSDQAAHVARWTPVPITWGRWSSRPPRVSLRLGSCDTGSQPLIRIHPVLDHEDVPRWFVGHVVHHEMLHLVHPPVVGSDGRQVLHGAAFRAAERAHPDHGRSMAWQDAHLGDLMRRCRARFRP